MKYRLNIFVLLLSIIFFSCKKEGVGGKSIIKGAVKHHGDTITNFIVYIKYGVKEFPGSNPSDYDSQTISDANGNYEFLNLNSGNYYLYSSGFDSFYSEYVKGGLYIDLKRKETKEVDLIVG